MDKFIELKNLYQNKKNNNECNEKQIEFLDTFLEDDYCFLRIKEKQALNIINFLGIPQDKVVPYYKEILIAMLKQMKSNQKTNKESL